MTPRLRLLATCFTAGLLAAAAPWAAAADPFPSRPMSIVVPAGAGGAADVLARALAEHMGPSLKTTVTVENKGGAGGIIGTEAVARAAPDGHTLLLTSNTLVITPALYKTSYDIHKDLAPVGLVASAPNLLVANAELKVSTLQGLLAEAKRSTGGLFYGSPAIGSAAQLTVELLAQTAGVSFTHVPFKGPQQALSETLAGRVPVTISGVSNAQPHIKTGKLVPLAVTGTKRSPLLPDVPTFSEAGIKGVDVTLWFALLAPGGTPPAVLQRLNAALNAALAAPEVARALQAQGFEAMGGEAATLAQTMKSEEAVYARIVKTAGITVK